MQFCLVYRCVLKTSEVVCGVLQCSAVLWCFVQCSFVWIWDGLRRSPPVLYICLFRYFWPILHWSMFPFSAQHCTAVHCSGIGWNTTRLYVVYAFSLNSFYAQMVWCVAFIHKIDRRDSDSKFIANYKSQQTLKFHDWFKSYRDFAENYNDLPYFLEPFLESLQKSEDKMVYYNKISKNEVIKTKLYQGLQLWLRGGLKWFLKSWLFLDMFLKHFVLKNNFCQLCGRKIKMEWSNLPILAGLGTKNPIIFQVLKKKTRRGTGRHRW